MEERKAAKTAYDERQSITYDEKRFATPHGVLFHKWELEQLQKVLQTIKHPGAVLEVGCGTGRFIKTILDAGFNAHGLDPSPYMLEMCKSKYQHAKKVEFDLAEGVQLPYSDGMFDFVYSIRTLNQTESRDYAFKMIQEMIRVVKPGGKLLIEFCNSQRPQFRPKTATLLSISDIQSLICDLKIGRLVSIRGIALLSQTFLNRVPPFLLPIWDMLDRALSCALPSFTARCYITIIKNA